MAQSKPKPADPLLDPFQSDLSLTPEFKLLAGTGAVTEAARFWTHRCKAYASYFDKLARCGNVVDLARLQATFWTDLQRDYLNEGAALVSTTTLTTLPAFARNLTPLRSPLARDASDAHPVK